GLADFERRFGRRPEGMWLPETAVDLESLEALAANGLQFTVLAPRQARRVRRFGERCWHDCALGVDPTRAYRVWLPSGRTLAVFFYDGPISLAVAFEGLLSSGETLVSRLLSGFSQAREWPQLVNIATDGETYGHHHRFGDMALSYALQAIEDRKLARLSNYAEYLAKHPPTWEAEIAENTSWSCVHGIERWRSDCGCRSKAEWKQAWRGPLREALDKLRDEVNPLFEAKASKLLRDPWEARDAYIELILDGSRKTADAFFERRAADRLDEAGRSLALKLLELQRQLMLMYTSCGWFFDDISGLETVQVLQYAARAAELAEEIFERPFHEGLAERLSAAKSNLPERRDGRLVYEKLARGAAVPPRAVCAQYALDCLFDDLGEKADLYSYSIEREAFKRMQAGGARLAVGRLRMRSRRTLQSHRWVFAALHLGDHNFHGGMTEVPCAPAAGLSADTAGTNAAGASREENDFRDDLCGCFDRADISGCMLLLGRRFGAEGFDLGLLFKDEQRKIISRVIGSALSGAVSAYRQLYANHASVLRFLKNQGLPAPKAVHMAAELTLHTDLRLELERPDPSPGRIAEFLEEADRGGIRMEADELPGLFRAFLERLTGKLLAAREDPAAIESLAAALRLLPKLPFAVDVWKVQNSVVHLIHDRHPGHAPGIEPAKQRYAELAGLLNLRLEPLPAIKSEAAPEASRGAA
ncbi:MAG: DUF3536 domain-containing protein, partial [Elusimicrobia bacterium]|nr:DUF3536 domain-containing protein [Elusimicrobiota bacterium]